MRAFPLTAFALVLALALPASAEHCTTYMTSAPELDTDPLGVGAAPRFYVDNDPCGAESCMFSLWVYEESNGIDGLQRGDEVRDGTCHGLVEPDTIIL